MLLHLTDSSPEPIRSQIARQLRGRILVGDLGEGSAVPDAHRVARDHRVSPRDVGQALEELASEGLLVRDGTAAFRVAAISTAQRRALAARRLNDDPGQQELSVRELGLAADIQRRFLPPALVEGAGYAVASRCFPARFVSGDFFDVLRHADGTVGVVVGDVAGKGFGASLVMAWVKAIVPFIAAERGVAETLEELNRRLCAELGRDRFVALAYARIAPASGRVELANAGIPDPFVVKAGRAPVALEAPGSRLPLGIRADVRYASVAARMGEDDRLVLFSDGIPEARRASGDALGYDGWAGILARSLAEPRGRRPIGPWLDLVLDEAQRAAGPALEDDWTAVAVERRREGPA